MMMDRFREWHRIVTRPERNFTGKRLLVWHCLSADHRYVHEALARIKAHKPLCRAFERGNYRGIIYALRDDRGKGLPPPPPPPAGIEYAFVDYGALARKITPGHDVTARMCKIATPLIFPEAEASVCMDADLDLHPNLGELDALFDLALRFGFVVTRHPSETWTGEPLSADQRTDYIARLGMRRFMPLYICGAVARGHAHPTGRGLTLRWTDEFLEKPTREQPTLAAAVWASGLTPLAAPMSNLSLERIDKRHGLTPLFVHNPGRAPSPTEGLTYLDDWVFYDAAAMPDKPSILEIGVFETPKLERLAAAHPGARFYCVEADPENYRTLCRRLPVVPNATAHNLALAEVDGECPVYHYDHEQRHSTFKRHENEGLPLESTATVPGLTLASMLDHLGLNHVDLLLLNCEGAEIWAFEHLCQDPALRARVGQISTSFHCDHCHIYPASFRDAALTALAPHFTWTVGDKPIPYYLFRRRP